MQTSSLHCRLTGTLLDFVASHQVCELLRNAVLDSLHPAHENAIVALWWHLRNELVCLTHESSSTTHTCVIHNYVTNPCWNGYLLITELCDLMATTQLLQLICSSFMSEAHSP